MMKTLSITEQETPVVYCPELEQDPTGRLCTRCTENEAVYAYSPGNEDDPNSTWVYLCRQCADEHKAGVGNPEGAWCDGAMNCCEPCVIGGDVPLCQVHLQERQRQERLTRENRERQKQVARNAPKAYRGR